MVQDRQHQTEVDPVAEADHAVAIRGQDHEVGREAEATDGRVVDPDRDSALFVVLLGLQSLVLHARLEIVIDCITCGLEQCILFKIMQFRNHFSLIRNPKLGYTVPQPLLLSNYTGT